MPRLLHTLKRVSVDGKHTIRILYLTGYLDAASYATFEKLLATLLKGGTRHLVLHFGKVEYINSTGISAIIRYHEHFQKAGGELVLAHVSREIGLTMHLLGLTNFVPVVMDGGTAVSYFKAAIREGALDGYFNWLRRRFRRGPRTGLRLKLPFWRRPPARPKQASILMVVPQADAFADVLKMRLHEPSGRFAVFTTCAEALARVDELQPDLVVLDHRVDGSEEFLAHVKIQKRRSLASVLKIYGHRRDLNALRDFKIWENDYVVEPFEVMQLFRLAEAEIQRVHRDRRVFLQQVRFQFRSTFENIERAQHLAKNLVEQVGLRGDAATAMLAAFHEAVDNAALHGNKRDSKKFVGVNLLVQEKKIAVTVEDQGAGFNHAEQLARAAPAQAIQEARRSAERGGLGIALMKKCVDRMQYVGRGNVLRFEKDIA